MPGSNETIVNPIVGIVPLALAAAALLAVPRRRAVVPLAGLALGAALFSLARFNLFHGLLYALLPGLEKARAPIMAMAIADVALAALAALGVDALLSRADTSTPTACATALRWVPPFCFCWPSIHRPSCVVFRRALAAPV